MHCCQELQANPQLLGLGTDLSWVLMASVTCHSCPSALTATLMCTCSPPRASERRAYGAGPSARGAQGDADGSRSRWIQGLCARQRASPAAPACRQHGHFSSWLGTHLLPHHSQPGPCKLTPHGHHHSPTHSVSKRCPRPSALPHVCKEPPDNDWLAGRGRAICQRSQP